MKNAIIRWLVLVALLWAPLALAQDVQELYDAARQSLLNGNYQSALNHIAEAKEQIALDSNLDPNGVFKNKLLPKIENTANAMVSIADALEALFSSTQSELVFPDLAPSVEAVSQYTLQAKNASEQLLAKRDSILSSYELEPEFNNALRNITAFKQIEQLASVGIVEQLSEKFNVIARMLTDSIQAINYRYETMAANLEKMKKTAAVNRAERKKLEEQLTSLSQERTNYMNAISEILAGETMTDNERTRMILLDQNLDTAFGNAIETEIKRVEALGEVDSVSYKELLKNYERVKKYNEIFAKNNVTGDQSDRLARYEAAIKNVKVIQPEKPNYLLFVGIAVAALILIFIIYRIVVSSQKRKRRDQSPDETSAPA